MVVRHFTSSRSLALGIFFVGTSLGMAVFTPISAFLISRYLWRGAAIIKSGIHLHGMIIGMLLGNESIAKDQSGIMQPLIPKKDCVNTAINETAAITTLEENNTRPYTLHLISKFMTLTGLIHLRNVPYLLHCISCSFIDAAHMCILTYLTYMGMALVGLSEEHASLIFTIFSVTSALLRIPSGFLGDICTNQKTLLIGSSICLVSTIGMILYYFPTFVSMCVYAVIYGCLSCKCALLLAVRIYSLFKILAGNHETDFKLKNGINQKQCVLC